MKKILIMMIASASMLLAEANTTTPVTTTDTAVKAVVVDKVVSVDTTQLKKPCKCKTKATVTPQSTKSKCTAMGKKCNCTGACKCKGMKNAKSMKHTKAMQRGKNLNKNKKRAKNSSLLLKKGLTPLLKIVMKSIKDPLLGLSDKQKSQLIAIKTLIQPKSIAIKEEIRTLSYSIVTAVTSGTTVEAIKSDMERLGSLRVVATLLRIKCINTTKAILTKDQLIYLLNKSTNKKSKKKKCNAKRCHSKK